MKEIEGLYAREHTWRNEPIKPDDNLLQDLSGELFDIQLEASPAGVKEFIIECRGVAVTYSAERKQLTCLGKAAPLDAPDDRLTLRVLVDRTSIEVFANDGQIAMSFCFLPAAENTGLELRSEGGSPTIRSMVVRELRSAWVTTRPVKSD